MLARYHVVTMWLPCDYRVVTQLPCVVIIWLPSGYHGNYLGLGGPKEEIDNEKIRDIRRLKWKKKLEQPARKILKMSHGKHRKTDDKSEVSYSPRPVGPRFTGMLGKGLCPLPSKSGYRSKSRADCITKRTCLIVYQFSNL